MAKSKEEQMATAIWWVDRIPLILGGVLMVALLVLLVWSWRIDQRLEHIEEDITQSLRYRPPSEAAADPSEPTFDPANAAEPDESADPHGARAVYVPVYSHIYHGEGEALLLTVTLSVRNTDRRAPIVLQAARYYDSAGQPLRNFVTKPLRVGPLGTVEYLVEESDISGGAGANFIVEWSADGDVSPAIIEAVMVGSAGGQGVSFLRTGVPLDR